MRIISAIFVLMIATGCSTMTDRQKAIAWSVGGAVVVGAIAAHDSSDSSSVGEVAGRCYRTIPPGIVQPIAC